MATIELTDEIRDEEPVGYLVFQHDKSVQECNIFLDDTEAKSCACRQAENKNDDKERPPGEWPMYPLYASHPEMVEPTTWIGKRK